MVKKLARVPYDEVVGYWLKFEYKDREELRKHIGSRFSHEDIEEAVVSEHDYSDQNANAKRHDMLESYRPFINWFSHAEWWRATLDENDISNLLVIHSIHWEKLSHGTLKAIDIARTIDENKDKEALSKYSGHVSKVIDGLEEKIREDSRIIIVAPKDGKVYTVIDGVHRAIRLCLYYIVRKNPFPGEHGLSQESYLGLTPDPIEYAADQWEKDSALFR